MDLRESSSAADFNDISPSQPTRGEYVTQEGEIPDEIPRIAHVQAEERDGRRPAALRGLKVERRLEDHERAEFACRANFEFRSCRVTRQQLARGRECNPRQKLQSGSSARCGSDQSNNILDFARAAVVVLAGVRPPGGNSARVGLPCRS